MDRIKREWTENEWVVIADRDSARFMALSETLTSIGFVREKIVHAKSATLALSLLAEHSSSILFLDDSLGTSAFRELNAHLTRAFGERGFFLFSITSGNVEDFVQFAAEARINGIIFRPYDNDEFSRRVSEVFSVMWPNRLVDKPDTPADFRVVGKTDREFFERAMEKEQRLGKRDPLTADPKVSSIFGLKSVKLPGVQGGKASFTKIRLAFRAVARNGEPLKKAFPIHALEVDDKGATFECAGDSWEAGDHLTIQAEITHGDENYNMCIEAQVIGGAGEGTVSVVFDKGNRTRFEAAMKMVAKRFKELKDFFKYAKGA